MDLVLIGVVDSVCAGAWRGTRLRFRDGQLSCLLVVRRNFPADVRGAACALDRGVDLVADGVLAGRPEPEAEPTAPVRQHELQSIRVPARAETSVLGCLGPRQALPGLEAAANREAPTAGCG